MNKTVFWCDCHDPDHQLIFEREFDDNFMMVHYRLNPAHHFWKRFLLGLRYIFQREQKLCQYGDIVLSPSEIKRLKDYLNVEYPDI